MNTFKQVSCTNEQTTLSPNETQLEELTFKTDVFVN